MYNKRDPRAIHETIIRDIVDVVTDVKDADEIQFVLGKGKSFKSVSSASSSLTIIFPHVVDRSIAIDRAIMINKAQERKCVTMLQMLFSAFAVTDAKNASDYIANFHTNLRLDDTITVDRFIGFMDDLANKLDENSGISVDMDAYNLIKEDMKNLDHYLPGNINESSLNEFKYIRLNGGNVIREAKADNQTPRDFKDATDALRNQVLDSDIKKANELMPTMMVVNFMMPDKNGTLQGSQAVIGVKVKMYPATTEDIIDRIKSKNRDSNGLNTFIRATTAEISFWKDFIFALNKAKLDALSSSQRGGSSPIWKLLERRALKSRLRRTFRFTNDATAITTLTLSSDTVEYLKKIDNIDLRSLSTARNLMELYNLMSIVIVDETLEYAEFIYDTGDDMYETVTFSSLEREASDSTYKKVVNLMTKMR